MKLNASWNPFRPENFATWQQWAIRFSANVGRLLDSLSQLLNGQITFGNGIDIDNIKGQWVTYSPSTSPGTEDAVAHDLGIIPVGFLVVVPPATGPVCRGATAWTTTHLYIVADGTDPITIFVLAPPVTE